MRRSPGVVTLAGVLATASLLSSPSSPCGLPASALADEAPKAAEPKPNDPKLQARVLAEKAFDDYESGRFEAAIEGFTKAEALFHAPTHKLFLARSFARLGRLRESKRSYEDLVNEALPASSPKAFVQAQSDAKAELETLKKRMPSFVVALVGASRDEVTLTLDGEPIDALVAAGPVLGDPGEHELRLEPKKGSDVGPQRRSLTLEEAAPPVRVELRVARLSKPINAPALASLGVGVVGLALGAVMAGLHFDRVGTLAATCPDKLCPASARPIIDEADTFSTVSTVGFVAGGVGLAAGLLFMTVGPFKKATPGFGAAPGPALRVVAGPTRASLALTF